MPTLTFWFDFASTYSWLTAMRIGPIAAARGVDVAWQPFLLGPIFRAQGWETSPFNLYPAKGRHMWIDLARQAAKYRLPAPIRPDPFPQNGLLAARVALTLGAEERPAFCRAVFAAEFGEAADISDPAILARFAGADAVARAGSAEIKQALRAATDRALELGIFGAPAFTTGDGALYWGDDRLEDALSDTAGPAALP